MKIIDYGQGVDYTIEIIPMPELGGGRFILQPAKGIMSAPGITGVNQQQFKEYLSALAKAMFHMGWTEEQSPPQEQPPPPPIKNPQ